MARDRGERDSRAEVSFPFDAASLPSTLPADLESLAKLPHSARDAYWEILEPNLEPVIDDGVAAIVDGFCRAHGIVSDDLAPSVRALRFLFRLGAEHGVEPKRFREATIALSGAPALVDSVVLPAYEKAFVLLRKRLMLGALTEHGKLVTGVDWRIDSIRASQGGGAIDRDVALVTFRYREGDKTERVTLQLVPESLVELRDACDRMLARR